MPKVADSIRRGLEDALAYADGDESRGQATVVRVPKRVNVRRLRRRLEMSQSDFARSFGFSLATLRDWEQGRRQPDRAARILLTVIDKEPDAVKRALAR